MTKFEEDCRAAGSVPTTKCGARTDLACDLQPLRSRGDELPLKGCYAECVAPEKVVCSEKYGASFTCIDRSKVTATSLQQCNRDQHMYCGDADPICDATSIIDRPVKGCCSSCTG